MKLKYKNKKRKEFKEALEALKRINERIFKEAM